METEEDMAAATPETSDWMSLIPQATRHRLISEVRAEKCALAFTCASTAAAPWKLTLSHYDSFTGDPAHGAATGTERRRLETGS